jgi:Leucine-rich repeat (LRR) protein
MEAAGDDVGDDVHAESLLSMPEGVHRMIVSRLAVAGQDEWSLVMGLKSLSLVCKPMQRAVDSYVTVLIEPMPGTRYVAAAVQRRWPHAVKAVFRSPQQVLQLLPGLPHLSELQIVSHAIPALGGVAAFTQLRYLELKRPAGPQRRNRKPNLTLAALPQLETMSLTRMRIANLPAISGFVGLRELVLRHCVAWGVCDDLSPLSTLIGLESLKLVDCRLSNLRPIGGLTQLKHLDLGASYSLSNLSPLSSLTGISSLEMYSCGKVTSLAPLSTLTGLSRLNISECKAVTSLEPLSSLTGLSTLDMRWCTAVTSLTPLSTLTGLCTLKMAGCSAVTSLQPLSTVASRHTHTALPPAQLPPPGATHTTG